MDYGYTQRPDGPSKLFHTRQITFPILFTVYHTFEPHSLDIVRFQPNSTRTNKELSKTTSLGVPPTPRRSSFANIADDSLQRRMEDEADDEHCLACLSVRNVYGVPFEVTLERRDGSSKLVDSSFARGIANEIGNPLTTSRLIPPGSTER